MLVLVLVFELLWSVICDVGFKLGFLMVNGCTSTVTVTVSIFWSDSSIYSTHITI